MAGLPNHFQNFVKKYPSVADAYDQIARASRQSGPLAGKTLALVKLGISVGTQTEGGIHAQVRKALEAGCTPEEIRHVVIVSLTTIGFPRMMAALSWVEDILKHRAENRKKKKK